MTWSGGVRSVPLSAAAADLWSTEPCSDAAWQSKWSSKPYEIDIDEQF
jgi:hypothetical protein